MGSKTPRFFSLGGIFGPILFALFTIVLAALRPDYSHLHQFISELGATDTPHSQFMNHGGFLPTGLLILLFGIAVFSNFRNGRMISRLGAILISLFGTGIFFAGLFSCDQGCPDVGSKESNIHQMLAPITFMSAILGVFLLGISFRGKPEWRKLWKYSVVSSILALVLIFALISSLETRMFTGLWQRLLLGILFLWTAVIGIHIYKLNFSKVNV